MGHTRDESRRAGLAYLTSLQVVNEQSAKI